MPSHRILLVRLSSHERQRPRHPQGVHLPFTLKYLQAILLKADYSVQWVDCQAAPCSLEDLICLTQEWRPHVIVISSTPRERYHLKALACSVRKHGDAITIAIGQDVSLDPSSYLNGSSGVDLAIPGEVEQVCAEAIDALRDRKGLKDLQIRFQGNLQRGEPILVNRLDDLPFPVYAQGELTRYPHVYPMPIRRRAVWGHLLATRGCPYPCMFCTQITRESYGARPRKRDPARVVDEMEYLNRQGATVLAFDDDNLTTDPQFVKTLCREMIHRRFTLPWIAHSRVDNLTPELAHWMRQAGCALLRFGIESAVARIVQLLKKGGDASSWPATTQRAIQVARANGIPTLGLFIIGNPTETESEVLETIRFALELPLDFAQVHFFTPYVGSGAYERFQEEVNPAVIPEQHHYQPPQVNLSAVETRRLVELRAAFYRRFYGRPGWVIRHTKRYAGFYMRNRQALQTLFAGRGVFMG